MEQVKLLMTELSPELTRLCAETLAAQDIAVTVCEKDGAKALAALSAEKPDAVLLDAFMPGLDALTVKQRYDEAGGGKTVFFVTCALPGFVDSKNEEKTERNAGYLVVSQSGGGMLRQGTREGIRRTPANRGMRAHRIVKGLDISEDVCHGMCP